MIIPIFIPHSGCPHQCVFCNQKNITGAAKAPDPAAMTDHIRSWLQRKTANSPVQAAFYGGSFTALPRSEQLLHLETVRPFIRSGQVESIRLSTRPDCINRDGLTLLQEYQVRTVELGVQSMDDRVLLRAGRGHDAASTAAAVRLLREYGFAAGLQLMPGLPGERPDSFRETVARVIALKPDFVRIYPALVIRDTPLAELYRTARYTPHTLDESVSLCRDALLMFEDAGIAVIRIGLQPTEELEKPGTILAGPYHPAFRQLVDSLICLEAMRSALRTRREGSDSAVFQVDAKFLSAAIGQKRSNIDALRKEFGLREIRIAPRLTPRGKREPVLAASE